MFHKCLYAVKHENMNFLFWFFNTNCTECYSVYGQMVGSVNMTMVFLTFKGPCIVIYSYNNTNEMH